MDAVGRHLIAESLGLLHADFFFQFFCHKYQRPSVRFPTRDIATIASNIRIDVSLTAGARMLIINAVD